MIYSCEYTWKYREEKYYSNKANFVNVTATVEKITYSEEYGKFYIHVDNISSVSVFSDDCFVIRHTSSQRLTNTNFLLKIQAGVEISFMAAPRYFGDGYCVPIVQLIIGDVTYLDFETGWNDLLSEY